MTIAEIQEGREWIAKLEMEAAALALDIMKLKNKDFISEYGVAALQFSLERTLSAIEEIKLEILFLDGDSDF